MRFPRDMTRMKFIQDTFNTCSSCNPFDKELFFFLELFFGDGGWCYHWTCSVAAAGTQVNSFLLQPGTFSL